MTEKKIGIDDDYLVLSKKDKIEKILFQDIFFNTSKTILFANKTVIQIGYQNDKKESLYVINKL